MAFDKPNDPLETTVVEVLRDDKCGEGFLWPLHVFVPQYCPICGAKNE